MIKITPAAKEEILEALEEKEWEDGEKWADENWYPDPEYFLPETQDNSFYDYCPECGDVHFVKGYPCNICGFPHLNDTPSLNDWDFDYYL